MNAYHMAAPIGAIGISGKIGTGKSTFAAHLVEQLQAHNIPARIFSFGSILKREAAKYFQYDPALALTQEGKDTKIFHPHNGHVLTVRQTLTMYGDMKRSAEPDYFIDRMGAQLQRFLSGDYPTVCVIDDVRYPGEAQLASRYGHLLRMHPHHEWLPGEVADHPTETALDNYEGFDFHVHAQLGQLEESARDYLRDALNIPPGARSSRPSSVVNARAKS